jgi:periplasmic divalent cation tolerance protein
MTKSIIWAIINCNSKKEADKIGRQLLKQRLIACFDIIPERESSYFWPPNTGKMESIKGSMLIGVTIASNYKAIATETKKLHSDKIPFIGSLKIENVNSDYSTWLQNELKKR